MLNDELTIETFVRLERSYTNKINCPDKIYLGLGYNANYLIEALDQLSNEMFDKNKQTNFFLSVYRRLTIGETWPWQKLASNRIVDFQALPLTYRAVP